MKEYTSTPLVIQTDGGVEQKIAVAGFLIFSPSVWESICVVRIDAGSKNNEAEPVAIC